MPGGHLLNPYRGNSSEYIAQVVLNAVSFAAYVPRQEDVGHDFICHLSEVRGSMLWAGPSFTVQVKSSRDPIVFEREHELSWLENLENEPVEYFATLFDSTGLDVAWSDRLLVVEVRGDCAVELSDRQRGEAENRLSGTSAQTIWNT